ncbi:MULTISPECIES: tyrosine-type recombinase/integrase [unclassified Methylobacterium]|uniref:tyrosine-type recombinase/integrase n=1 Tax=unclassified Methylobacterium TaxID=2615210 RepID=UPI000CBF3459|nr:MULTISPECIES: tyrosine-type recombinase/integrase [unclassified Methylobacterium]PIU05076.1 MAG: integrase [Methylobacterium sp. CG09_land_8_20_14_0_10_71_15]PIU11866.1 MAG: integrase [Methylobacterium sp. CG08_land_8_20_14_0_20_71_15]
MPRTPDPKDAYLEKHGGYFRVTMSVPKKLRPLLGSRLVKSLKTDSLLSARMHREPVVREFKKRIEDAWLAYGGKERSVQAEAVETAKLLKQADENMHDFMWQGVKEREAEILRSETRPVIVEEFGRKYHEDHPTEEAVRKATEFRLIASGEIPIGLFHEEFMKQLRIKERSKLDEPRALALFLDWLKTQEVYPFISNIGNEEAKNFVRWLENDCDLSWASKAKYLGRFKVYWAWLRAEGHAKEDPFYGRVVRKEVREDGEEADEERPYTDTEVQRLFMGEPLEGRSMLDVMAVAALTGARLDAVICLKVGETEEGLFRFKRQKKEKTDRYVPIHPDLHEIVARRIEGKSPDDDFFDDWPGPKPPSKKPRSSYFSKRFTFYSKKIGVRDEIAGKRRSLVNFHSFRRWFITKLEREGVPGDMIKSIVGHARGSLTLDRYSSGPELKAALEAISRVKLPPLDGTPVIESRGLKPIRRQP